MHQRIQRMENKGWSKIEISEAIKKVSSKEKNEKHSAFPKHSASILYYTTLTLLFVCNLIVSVVLVPLLVMINNWSIYLIITILGLVLGILFSHLINDIEHLSSHHHIAAAVFVPLVGVLNLFIIIPIANNVRILLNVGTINNPIAIACVYVCAFLIPYLIADIKKKTNTYV